MFFVPKIKRLSNDELLAQARRVCEIEGWPWLEPIGIQDHWRDWTIVTNCNKKGRNARIVVSKKTGEVIKKIFIPR